MLLDPPAISGLAGQELGGDDWATFPVALVDAGMLLGVDPNEVRKRGGPDSNRQRPGHSSSLTDFHQN